MPGRRLGAAGPLLVAGAGRARAKAFSLWSKFPLITRSWNRRHPSVTWAFHEVMRCNRAINRSAHVVYVST